MQTAEITVAAIITLIVLVRLLRSTMAARSGIMVTYPAIRNTGYREASPFLKPAAMRACPTQQCVAAAAGVQPAG